jgi:cytochrome bd-type quinol oxidase subunit 2
MKYLPLTLLCGLLLISLTPSVVTAANFGDSMLQLISSSDLPSAGDNAEKLDPILAKIINVFLSVFGIIFMSIILYAGYIWMKANGREDEIDRAKKMIQNSIIGLGLTFTAYVISNFVVSQFWNAVHV